MRLRPHRQCARAMSGVRDGRGRGNREGVDYRHGWAAESPAGGKVGRDSAVRIGRCGISGQRATKLGNQERTNQLRHLFGLRRANVGPLPDEPHPRNRWLTIRLFHVRPQDRLAYALRRPFESLMEWRVLPYWFLCAVIAVPTLLLWRLDRRRIPPGHCRKCGYDLTGNVSGRCPECGTAR